jgi:chemotaxis protein MotB
MCARFGIAVLATLPFALSAGCNQGPGLNAQAAATNGWQQQPTQPYAAQLQNLDQRANALDVDNRDLHTELARSEQQVQLLKDELQLLRGRLADTANQLQELQLAKQETETQMEAFQASAKRGGGAILKANNSLKDSLHLIQIPGTEVRQDGDVVRIELPADQLFQPGTSQLLPSAYNLLDQLANSITRAYPKQMVGIEGYADSSALNTTSSHQLTAAQTIAVLDVLTRRNRLPGQQLFTVGHGSNHPLASNATAAGRAKNRRIELAIYPETVGGN